MQKNSGEAVVVQKARCARLLYNAERLHRCCTKFSLRSPIVQQRFCKIEKNFPLRGFFQLRKAAPRSAQLKDKKNIK